MSDDPRAELAGLAASLRAYLEWQQDAGTVGISPAAIGARTGSGALAPRRRRRYFLRSLPRRPRPLRRRPLPRLCRPPRPRRRPDRRLRLAQLAAEVSACTKCVLSATRTQTVFSRGNPDARALLHRRGAGRRRGRAGAPFRGPCRSAPRPHDRRDGPVSGERRLRLQHPQVPPPGNRRPEPEEMAACFPYLHEQLALVSPRVIVALGNTAVAALLETKLGITKLRGQWKLYRGKTLRHADVPPLVPPATEPPADRGEAPDLGGSPARDEGAGARGPEEEVVGSRTPGASSLLRGSARQRRTPTAPSKVRAAPALAVSLRDFPSRPPPLSSDNGERLRVSLMAEPIEQLVQRWKRSPSPATTIALCDALRGTTARPPRPASGGSRDPAAPNDVGVLVSVARMYIEAQRFGDAQTTLVAAGKQAPRDGAIYRWLGEVLLRRGDAERAEKVLERAIQLGTRDPDARLWMERARVFRPMQAKAGTRAVATEVAHATAAPATPLLRLPQRHARPACRYAPSRTPARTTSRPTRGPFSRARPRGRHRRG